MNQKLKTFVFIFLLLSASILTAEYSYSQKNFLPGFIVKMNGDTIRGLVNYQNWDLNPGEVEFKVGESGNQTAYTPLTIASFGVNDEYWVSASVDIEVSNDNAGTPDRTPDLNLEKDTVFLKVLVQGEKSLYFYKSYFGTNNFYAYYDGRFVLLEYKEFQEYVDGRYFNRERTTYKGQLTAYLGDCSSLGPRVSASRYMIQSMVKLYSAYYKCVDKQPTYILPYKKVQVDFNVMAGMTLSSINFKSDSYNKELVSTDFSPSYNLIAGLGLDVQFPYGKNIFSVNNELVYTSYKCDGTYEGVVGSTGHEKIEFEIGASYIKLNTMGRYKYPVGKIFLFGELGVTNGILVSSTNYARTTRTFGGEETVKEDTALDEMKSYEFGYLAGLGVNFNHFSLEGRYEKSSGTSTVLTLSSPVHRLHIILSYSF